MPIVSTAERIGTVLGGRYHLTRLLGEGGMGAVFEGEHTMTRRKVAVKLLHPEVAAKGDFTGRFLQEAQAASMISHEHVAQVLDMGTDDGALFLVMEFLAGEDLEGRLHREKKLPYALCIELLIPVMDALVSAHGKGIIHRDLKPANIFLARMESGAVVPKLLDFGISKVTQESSMARTQTGAVLGTPDYMAPEQARGLRELDSRVDVWAMGVVMYECLTGTLPFPGDNYNQVMLSILESTPVPIRTLAPEVPEGLAGVIARAMARDLKHRMPTMREFITALAPYRAVVHTGAGASPSGTGRFRIENDSTVLDIGQITPDVQGPPDANAVQGNAFTVPVPAVSSSGPAAPSLVMVPTQVTGEMSPAVSTTAPASAVWGQARSTTGHVEPVKTSSRRNLITAGILGAIVLVGSIRWAVGSRTNTSGVSAAPVAVAAPILANTSPSPVVVTQKPAASVVDPVVPVTTPAVPVRAVHVHSASSPRAVRQVVDAGAVEAVAVAPVAPSTVEGNGVQPAQVAAASDPPVEVSTQQLVPTRVGRGQPLIRRGGRNRRRHGAMGWTEQ